MLSTEQEEKLTQIGAHLRQRRLELDVPLEDISNRTKIRKYILEAIEEAQVEELPQAVYLPGFIRHYGNALKLNGQELADAFSKVPATPEASENLTPELSVPVAPASKIASTNRSANLKPALAILPLLLLTVGAIGGGLFFWQRQSAQNLVNTDSEPNEPEGETRPRVVEGTIKKEAAPPKVKPSAIPTPETEASPAPLTASATEALAVKVSLEGSSWMQVKIDGKTEFEGILKEGDEKVWKADKELIIRSGNAGVVKVAQGGQPAKPLGQPGAVEEVILTANQ